MKYEKKLKAAREQVKANYEIVEQESKDKDKLEGELIVAKKPPRPTFDDKTCLQAPDDSPK